MKTLSTRHILHVEEAEFHTDEKTGRMTGKIQIIKAGRAKGKKRDYTSQALRQAAKEGIYNGIRMFVDHSDKTPLKRSMQELVSAVESTEYNPKTDAIDGQVEFFNKDFFDYAQRAKKYMGVSASHQIMVNNVMEGRDTIQRVVKIPSADSVDWVVYPAAGGEALSFAQESEGVEDVDWEKVTLKDLKEHAPTLLEEHKKEVAKESEEPEEDPKLKKTNESEDDQPMSKAEVTRLVQEQVQSIQKASEAENEKRIAAGKKIREFVGKAGLPQRVATRIINSFADATEYVEESVKASVDDAKEEMKELGVRGPKITGNGTTQTTSASESETEAPRVHHARESVEAAFGVKTKKVEAKKDDKKED